MLTLFTFPSPHGHRASIMLEEVGLPYRVHRVELGIGGFDDPELRAVSPLAKVPALVDPDGPDGRAVVFGSGAILTYLAEKTGLLWPSGAVERVAAHSWLMLSLSDLGPAMVSHFRFTVMAPERIPFAVDMFEREIGRCLDALDQRLAEAPFLAGGHYSVADVAAWPMVDAAAKGDAVSGRPALARWHAAIALRPAVQRGMAVPG